MITTRSIVAFLIVFITAGESFHHVNGKTCTADKFDCTRWAKAGKCKTMKGWMRANCCAICKAVEKEKGKCVYIESTCSFWANNGYCTGGAFKSFMKENCCKTCKGYKPKPTKAGCVDDKGYCGEWAKRGYCKGTYKDFMKKHCCKTCAAEVHHTTIPLPTEKQTTIPLPTEPLPTEKPGCTDDNMFCGRWAEKGWCTGEYKDFMKKHCCKTCAGTPRRTKPPTKPTRAPRRTTSPPKRTLSPSCKDDNKLCESWAKIGECERNKGFMKLHCCKSCSKKPTCTDDRDLCEEWAKQGACIKNKDFMRIHCCKTCKGKHPSCVDDNKLCKSWAESGECKTNPGFMLVHCQKSCKAC